MNQNFKSDMESLAGRVEYVDLTDRAQHTANRLRVTRAGIAGFAVLALAGGATLGYAAIPSDSPAAAGGLDGRFVFTGPKVYSDDEEIPDDPDVTHIDISVWDGESNEVTTFSPAEPLYLPTAQMSPDGEWLSYVGADKKVRILDLDDGANIAVPELDSIVTEYPVAEGGVVENFPVWAPDSRLWVDSGADSEDDRFGFVDIETGDFDTTQPPAGVSTRVTESEDGTQHLVSLRPGESEGLEMVKVNADGEGTEEVMSSDAFDGAYITGIGQISADGFRVCVTTEKKALAEPVDFPVCNTIAAWAPDNEDDPEMPTVATGESHATLVGDDDAFLREQGNDFLLTDSKETELRTVTVPEEIKYEPSGLLAYAPPRDS